MRFAFREQQCCRCFASISMFAVSSIASNSSTTAISTYWHVLYWSPTQLHLTAFYAVISNSRIISQLKEQHYCIETISKKSLICKSFMF